MRRRAPAFMPLKISLKPAAPCACKTGLPPIPPTAAAPPPPTLKLRVIGCPKILSRLLPPVLCARLVIVFMPSSGGLLSGIAVLVHECSHQCDELVLLVDISFQAVDQCLELV